MAVRKQPTLPSQDTKGFGMGGGSGRGKPLDGGASGGTSKLGGDLGAGATNLFPMPPPGSNAEGLAKFELDKVKLEASRAKAENERLNKEVGDLRFRNESLERENKLLRSDRDGIAMKCLEMEGRLAGDAKDSLLQPGAPPSAGRQVPARGAGIPPVPASPWAGVSAPQAQQFPPHAGMNPNAPFDMNQLLQGMGGGMMPPQGGPPMMGMPPNVPAQVARGPGVPAPQSQQVTQPKSAGFDGKAAGMALLGLIGGGGGGSGSGGEGVVGGESSEPQWAPPAPAIPQPMTMPHVPPQSGMGLPGGGWGGGASMPLMMSMPMQGQLPPRSPPGMPVGTPPRAQDGSMWPTQPIRGGSGLGPSAMGTPSLAPPGWVGSSAPPMPQWGLPSQQTSFPMAPMGGPPGGGMGGPPMPPMGGSPSSGMGGPPMPPMPSKSMLSRNSPTPNQHGSSGKPEWDMPLAQGSNDPNAADEGMMFGRADFR